MMPGIKKTILVLTGMTLQTVDKPLALAMKIMVLTLSIPPFLVLHLVFNVELLRPYFPPLLDTLEVDKQLAPIELNHNFLD
jgi:hypothetical protein